MNFFFTLLSDFIDDKRNYGQHYFRPPQIKTLGEKSRQILIYLDSLVQDKAWKALEAIFITQWKGLYPRNVSCIARL